MVDDGFLFMPREGQKVSSKNLQSLCSSQLVNLFAVAIFESCKLTDRFAVALHELLASGMVQQTRSARFSVRTVDLATPYDNEITHPSNSSSSCANGHILPLNLFWFNKKRKKRENKVGVTSMPDLLGFLFSPSGHPCRLWPWYIGYFGYTFLPLVAWLSTKPNIE